MFLQSLQPKVEKMEAAWARLHTITGAETPEEVIAYFEGAALTTAAFKATETWRYAPNQALAFLISHPAGHGGLLPDFLPITLSHTMADLKQKLPEL